MNSSALNDLLSLAEANQQRARAIIRDTQLEAAWHSIGARVELVGSLRTGLLMDHRDIDFHVYSPTLDLADSFAAMGRLAAHPRIRRVEYANLLDAEDRCLEWHAWYEDDDGAPWQIDLIHMSEQSPWAGYFERVADRIAAVLTDRTREVVLRLKHQTPPELKIPGIAYYQAVLRDGVACWSEFEAWRREHPTDGIVEWMP